MIKSIRQKRPTVSTSENLLLRSNASNQKAKVTVTFLKEQNIQVLDHPHNNFDLAPCDVWLSTPASFPQRKVGSAQTSLHSGPHKSGRFRALCIVSTRRSKCLWILAHTIGTACAKRRRVLWRNVNIVRKLDGYFLFYWPADIIKWTATKTKNWPQSVWVILLEYQ